REARTSAPDWNAGQGSESLGLAANALLKELRSLGIRPPSKTEQYRLCAMERNSVRASDARVLLAPKVIAAVIGIIGIALLALALHWPTLTCFSPLFGDAIAMTEDCQKGSVGRCAKSQFTLRSFY